MSALATHEVRAQDDTGYEHRGSFPDPARLSDDELMGEIDRLDDAANLHPLAPPAKQHRGDCHREIQRREHQLAEDRLRAKQSVDEVHERLERLYAEVPTTLTPLLDLVEELRAVRVDYEGKWSRAERLDVAPERLAKFLDRGPQDYPTKQLIDRFRTSTNGW